MKNLYTSLILLILFVINVSAQAPPEAFNYSGVARNAQNNPLVNRTIGVQFGILKSTINGTLVYQENHVTTTDAFGVFDLAVGTGAIQSGVFANIVWGNDKYFLSVGLDTAGGTNFILMGTTQLLSVPYALYAKSAGTTQYQTLSLSHDTLFLSPNGGFIKLPSSGGASNTILLTGDITDADAATKIQQELGPNTQNVYILNTTQLTTANFDSLSEVIEIRIENNTALQSVSFAGLATAQGNINISGNTVLQAASFPALKTTFANLTISSNPAMQTVSCPQLDSANGSISISATTLNTASFSSLKSANSFGLFLDTIATLSTVSLPLLDNISSSLNIESPSLSLSTIDLPLLKQVKGSGMSIQAQYLTTLNAPVLKYVQRFSIRNTSLTSLSLPALDSIGGDLYISGSPLTSVNFSSLKRISNTPGANIEIYNTSLTSLNFLSSVDFGADGPGPALDFARNKLTSSSVNSILAWLVALNVHNFGILDLSGQTPPAPPTGQGVTDVQTLTNRGFNVTTD